MAKKSASSSQPRTVVKDVKLGNPIMRGREAGLDGFKPVELQPLAPGADSVKAEWLAEMAVRIAALSRSSSRDATNASQSESSSESLGIDLAKGLYRACSLIERAQKLTKDRSRTSLQFPAFFTTEEIITDIVRASRAWQIITGDPVRKRAKKKWEDWARAVISSRRHGTPLPEWFASVGNKDVLNGKAFFRLDAVIAQMGKYEEYVGEPLDLTKKQYKKAGGKGKAKPCKKTEKKKPTVAKSAKGQPKAKP